MTDFNPSEDTIKILTAITDQPSSSTIQKLDTGYKWDFGTTELTLNVSDGGVVDVDQLSISFDLV